MTKTPFASPAAESLAWESQVGALLAELSDVQTELLSVLQQKRERLAAVDLPGLAALQPQEEALMHRLDACQRQRRELLDQAAAAGRPSDSMGKLTGTASRSERGKLGEQVKHSSAQMRLLQHHSLANWVLSPAVLAACVATSGNYRHRRANAADLW